MKTFKRSDVKMLKCLNVKMKERGFTIIELIVAMAVFSLVISSAIGLFVAGIRSQRNILITQKLLDETSYTMEYMSRYIRMAVRDDEGECIMDNVCNAIKEKNYDNPSPPGSELAIRFIDYGAEKCHQFASYAYGSRNVIAEWRSDLTANVCNNMDYTNAVGTPLTSQNFWVKDLEFKLTGENMRDGQQPRVTILMDIAKGASEPPGILIQTTISQRNLNISK